MKKMYLIITMIFFLLLTGCDNSFNYNDPTEVPDNPDIVEEKYLIYETNGGTIHTEKELIVENKIIKLEEPQKDGDYFIGWYKDEELKRFQGHEYVTERIWNNKDVIMYAKYGNKEQRLIYEISKNESYSTSLSEDYRIKFEKNENHMLKNVVLSYNNKSGKLNFEYTESYNRGYYTTTNTLVFDFKENKLTVQDIHHSRQVRYYNPITDKRSGNKYIELKENESKIIFYKNSFDLDLEDEHKEFYKIAINKYSLLIYHLKNHYNYDLYNNFSSITYKHNDEVISYNIYEKGDFIVHPTVEKEKFTFDGWIDMDTREKYSKYTIEDENTILESNMKKEILEVSYYDLEKFSLKIKSVHSGDDILFLITESNKVFFYGVNKYNVALMGNDRSLGLDLIEITSKLKLFDEEYITDIKISNYNTFFITSKSRVLASGPINNNNKNRPLILYDFSGRTNMKKFMVSSLGYVIENDNKNFVFDINNNLSKQLESLLNHTNSDIKDIEDVFLTDGGMFIKFKDKNVYGIGIKNNEGQLGNGTYNNKLYKSLNSLMTLNENEEIIDVVGSYTHSVILTNKGNVYGFGLNKKGVVGKGFTNTHTPISINKDLNIADHDYIVEIQSNNNNTLIRSKDNFIFGLGEDMSHLEKLTNENKNIKNFSLSADNNSSFAILLYEDGSIYHYDTFLDVTNGNGVFYFPITKQFSQYEFNNSWSIIKIDRIHYDEPLLIESSFKEGYLFNYWSSSVIRDSYFELGSYTFSTDYTLFARWILK